MWIGWGVLRLAWRGAQAGPIGEDLRRASVSRSSSLSTNSTVGRPHRVMDRIILRANMIGLQHRRLLKIAIM
jgi:hypothetical protein